MMNIVEGNSYQNSFDLDGSDMLVSYFLSERTKSDAPIIQRIISSQLAVDRDADRLSLHLFCRAAPNLASSADASAVVALGYVYFGRLEYVEHDAAARPIRFRFRLRDYAAACGTAPLQRLLRLAMA